MEENKYCCKIDGIVYNLKKIQNFIDENPENPDDAKIYLTLNNDYQIPQSIANMLLMIIKETKEIPADYNEALKELQARNRKKYGIPERFRHSDDSCDKSNEVSCESVDMIKYTRVNKYSCRIDGVVYNLKKIQNFIDENPENPDDAKIYLTLNNDYQIPQLIANMLLMIIKETKEIPADYNEALKELQARNRKKYGIPKQFRYSAGCPRCGSTNFSKPIWSLYDYKCGTCGHEWVRCPRCGGSNIKIRRIPPVSAVKNSLNKCKDCGHDWRRI